MISPLCKNIIVALATILYASMCFSCKTKKQVANENLLEKAISSILNYKHNQEHIKNPSIALIESGLVNNKFTEVIDVMENYHGACGAFPLNSAAIDTTVLNNLNTNLKFLKLSGYKKETSFDLHYFSPLIPSAKENEFCMICRTENYARTSTFVYKLRLNNSNGEMEVEKIVDGFIVD